MMEDIFLEDEDFSNYMWHYTAMVASSNIASIGNVISILHRYVFTRNSYYLEQFDVDRDGINRSKKDCLAEYEEAVTRACQYLKEHDCNGFEVRFYLWCAQICLLKGNFDGALELYSELLAVPLVKLIQWPLIHNVICILWIKGEYDKVLEVRKRYAKELQEEKSFELSCESLWLSKEEAEESIKWIDNNNNLFITNEEELNDTIWYYLETKGKAIDNSIERLDRFEVLIPKNNVMSIIQESEEIITIKANVKAISEEDECAVNEKVDCVTLSRSNLKTGLVGFDEQIEKLNSLVGLNSIKADVNNIINLTKMQIRRKEQGLKAVPISLHLVFSGNPGTGKTTIARILADIYKEIGVLSKGQFVEVDRAGLVAGYVGQTAIKTQEKIEEALGGILFIDEAYTLAKDGNDYGQEAIDTILKAMEDHRDDFIVIVAGYSKQMRDFINSNPGLRSRFNKYIEFPDYSVEEMVQIFERMCDEYQYRLSDEAREIMVAKIIDMEANKGENFANARDVRNLFESAITHQASRFAAENNGDIREIAANDFDK